MAQHRDPVDRPFRRFCATGDPDALGDVFDLTAARLLRVAVWLTDDRTDAEDLLQRTFLKAIETRSRFRRSEPVLPWLMGLLGNEARRLRRDRERAARSVPPRDRVADPEVTVIANELAAEVRSVGERLGAPYDDVLRLHLEAGLNCAEIAARLDRPAGTVRTQLMRALDALRRRLPSGFVAGLTVSATAVTATAGAPAVRAAVVAAARDAMRATAETVGAAAASHSPPGGALSMKKFAWITAPALTAIVVGATIVPALRQNPPATAEVAGASATAPEPGSHERTAPTIAATTHRVPAPRPEAELPRVDAPGNPPARPADLVLAADGRRIDALPAATGSDEPALLHVDRDAPWRDVIDLLGELRARGFHQVQFACVTQAGAPGCFTLALPEHANAQPAWHMHLHRERVGVTAPSVEPVLRRIVRGRAAIRDEVAEPGDARFPETYTLGVDAPGDARFERVLDYLAAACTAGVQSMLLTADSRTAPGAASDDLLAVDLGPVPHIAVREGATMRAARRATANANGVFGCTCAPDAARPEPPHGGAGGRYGGRGSRRAGPPTSEAPDATELAIDWLVSRQRPDGALCTDGAAADVEGTALAMLALLADGTTMHRGPHHEALAAGIGWLLANQADDGGLAPQGPDAVVHHAFATTALAEAYGLGTCLEVRGGLQDALSWLHRQWREDGGFARGVPGWRSDVRATAAVGVALQSAEFFRVQAGDETSALVAGDVGRRLHQARHQTGTPERGTPERDTDAAASLFGMLFAGVEIERTDPRWQHASTVPQRTAADDPRACYWAVLVAMQIGEDTWKAGRKRLEEIERNQLPTGDLRGSWHPAHGCSRVVTTALHTLSLQVARRYSRLIR